MSLELQALDQGREWTRQRLEKLAQDELNGGAMNGPQSGQLLLYRKKTKAQAHDDRGRDPAPDDPGLFQGPGPVDQSDPPTLGPQAAAAGQPGIAIQAGFHGHGHRFLREGTATATRWGTKISDDTVPAVVQQLGAASEDLTLPPIPAPKPEPEFSMVIMMDGGRVRRRGPHWGAGRRKKNPQRVEWKEVKSAVIYRLEQSVKKASGRGLLLEKYIVACPPETSPVDFGSAVQAEALRRGLGRAKKVYVVIDGAVCCGT